MSLYDTWHNGFEARDASALGSCLHDDFEFVRHQSGTTMNKAQMIEMLEGFMSSDAVKEQSRRCLYENSDIMVEHAIVDFADGSREAILTCHTLKDGQIIRMETGASPVQRHE